jgi:HEAT repeat protein
MNDIEKNCADLKSGDPRVRAAAAERLCTAGPAAAAVAVELVQACCDDDESVQTWAAAALEDMGPPGRNSVAALVALAPSEHPLVAYWAITLLGRLGPDAVACEEALANVLTNSSDTNIREQAAWALGKIGVSTDRAVVALKRAQDSGTARLVRLAREALQPAPR